MKSWTSFAGTILARVFVVTAIAHVVPAAAQGKVEEKRIVEFPRDVVAPPTDLGQVASASDAVVVAKFVEAKATIIDRAGEGGTSENHLRTHLHFVLVDAPKSHSRMVEPGASLVVLDSGGGEFVTKPQRRIVKASNDSQRFEKGHKYLLYLSWWDAEDSYTLNYGPFAVFDVTSESIRALVDTTELGKTETGQNRDGFLDKVRHSAMTAPKSH